MRNAADQGDVTAAETSRNERSLPEIIEFSCPYADISHERDAFQGICEQKKDNYADLANELKRRRRGQIRVTAMIVSSMGAADGPSLKDLQKILKFNDPQMRKLGKRMPAIVIANSIEIWRQNAHQIERGTNGDLNVMMEGEVENPDRAAAELEMGVNVEVELDIEARVGTEAEIEAQEHEEADLGEDDADDLSAESGQGEFEIGNGNEKRVGDGATARAGVDR
jgi:hypothetical protein